MFWDKNITAKKLDKQLVDIINKLRVDTRKKVSKILINREDILLYRASESGQVFLNTTFDFWRLMQYLDVFYSGNFSTFIGSFVSTPKSTFKKFKKELQEEFIKKFCKMEFEIVQGKKYSEEEMKEFFIFSKIHNYVPIDDSMRLEESNSEKFEDIEFQEIN